MAKIIICYDIFDAKAIKEFVVEKDCDIRKLLLDNNFLDNSSETIIEKYNPNTKTTDKEVVLGDYTTKVYVNSEEKDLDYKCEENDTIAIFILPKKDIHNDWNPLGWFNTGGFIAAGIGTAMIVAAGWTGMGLAIGAGLVAAGTLQGIWGLQQLGLFEKPVVKTTSMEDDANGADAPTVSGAENSSIIGNTIPFAIGKYRVSPFLGASAYTTFNTSEDEFGRSQYINNLYVLGYAPVLPTEFNFGSLPFAHNKKRIIDGLLSYKNNSEDNTEIESRWGSNNVELEIKQLGDYSSLYPYTVKETHPNAALLYCCDKAYSEIETEYNIDWGGSSYPCGFKTNSVYFSKDIPRRIEVDLDFPNGLYATRSQKKDDSSRNYYKKIDLCLGIQYRVRTKAIDSKNDSSTSAFRAGLDEGWINFDGITTGRDIKVKYGEVTQREIKNNVGMKFKDSNNSVTIADIESITVDSFTETNEGVTNITFRVEYTTGASVLVESKTYYKYGNFAKEITWYNPDISIGKFRVSKFSNITIEKGDTTATIRFYIKDGLFDKELGYHTVPLSDFIVSIGSGTNPYWNKCDVFNFGKYSTGKVEGDFISGISTSSTSGWDFPDGKYFPKNEMRFTAYADIPDDIIKQLCKLSENADENSVLDSLEVRVIRLTPCYIDDTTSVSGVNNGPTSYSDIVKWTTLRTYSYDKQTLLYGGIDEKGKEIPVWDKKTPLDKKYYQRPYSFEDSQKLCVVALKCKADKLGVISENVDKMSVLLQAFAPKWSEKEHKWFPETIKQTEMYHCICYKDSVFKEVKNFYEKDFDDKQSWIGAKNTWKTQKENDGFLVEVYKEKAGNDWWKIMNKELSSNQNKDLKGRFVVNDDIVQKYISNNAMSGIALSFVGQHLGKSAYGYDAINMAQLAESWMIDEHMTDGSMENGVEKEMCFAANGYIYQSKKLSDVFASCMMAGRAFATIDELDRWEVHVDIPQENPVVILNQENTISCTNTRSFEESISGYRVEFTDEDDNYEVNKFYVMKDGEDKYKPSRDIKEFKSYEFVTNNYQYNSLARYSLAANILQKEAWTRVVGPIAYQLKVGSLVFDAQTSVLTGTDYGARIEQLVEDNDYIYGFVADRPYNFTAEYDDDGKNKLGVMIFQTGENIQQSYCTVKLLGKDGAIIPIKDGIPDSQGEETLFTMEKSFTNTVLFATPIIKSSNTLKDESYKENSIMTYNPKIGDVASFGYTGEIVQKALVMAIKPEGKHKFSLTLIPYNEELYTSGRNLPVYSPHMTTRDLSADTIGSNYELQDVKDLYATKGDIDNLAEFVNFTFSLGVNGDGTKPNLPSNLKAIAGQDSVELTWDSYTSENALYNKISYYTVEIAKDGVNFQVLNDVNNNSFSYVFDRSVDGYPEKDDISSWKFRVKSTNIYGVESDGYANADIDLSKYGTWLPPRYSKEFWKPIAVEDGIEISSELSLDDNTIYYGLPFVPVYEYSSNGEDNWRDFINSAGYRFYFNREVDGYPEKEDLDGKAKVRAYLKSSFNFYRKAADGKPEYISQFIDFNSYGTWIPTLRTTEENSGVAPTRVNISHRSATFTGSQPTGRKVYGDIRYGLQINKVETDGEEYFTPATDLDPYESEENYKNSESKEPLWTSRNFNQILPLTGQNGYMWQLDQKKERVVTNSNGTDSSIEYANKTTYIPVKDLLTSKDFYDTSVISEFIPNHFDTENATIGQSVEWTRDRVQDASYVKDDGSKFDSTKEYSKKMDAFVLKVGSDTILAIEKNIGMVMFERDRS